MRFQIRSRHMIDIIFPILLFCVFTLSALTVLLLAANVYRSATVESARRNDAHTALAYISEKVHRFDTEGNIAVGDFDGCEALVLTEVIDEVPYHTYIYTYDGKLREILLKDGSSAAAGHGTEVLSVESFDIEALSGDLISFSCTDSEGRTASSMLAIRSEGGDE